MGNHGASIAQIGAEQLPVAGAGPESARSTLKRARLPDLEAEQSSKKKKHSPEVNCPRPLPLVKLKLTRVKISPDTQHSRQGSLASGPDSAKSLPPRGLSDGTSRSERPSTSTRSRHVLRSARRRAVREDSEETEKADMPPSHQSRDYSTQNGRSAGQPAPSLPTQQERSSERLRVAEPANTRAAPSSQASESIVDAGQTAIRDAAPDRVESTAGETPTTSAHPTTDRPQCAMASKLTRDIIMVFSMERDNEEAEVVRAASLEGVTTTCGLFALVHDQIDEFVAAGEAIVRVGVKRHSASPTTKDLMAGFVMKPESSQSGKDQSWEMLLKEMQDRFVETGVCVRIKLEATVLVGKAVGESRQ